mmetsp:Transcript_8003/g.25246  ORF Transcript_8003/g.25246 Transcript_8003/m.25246 type:complete len:268 (-) Transcript_8003:275-1078(-)
MPPAPGKLCRAGPGTAVDDAACAVAPGNGWPAPWLGDGVGPGGAAAAWAGCACATLAGGCCGGGATGPREEEAEEGLEPEGGGVCVLLPNGVACCEACDCGGGGDCAMACCGSDAHEPEDAAADGPGPGCAACCGTEPHVPDAPAGAGVGPGGVACWGTAPQVPETAGGEGVGPGGPAWPALLGTLESGDEDVSRFFWHRPNICSSTRLLSMSCSCLRCCRTCFDFFFSSSRWAFFCISFMSLFLTSSESCSQKRSSVSPTAPDSLW